MSPRSCIAGTPGALFYTEQKALQFPALLLRMEMRANAAIQESQSAVSTISAELQRKGLTIVQVLPHSQQSILPLSAALTCA